jgi:hypothetical protein
MRALAFILLVAFLAAVILPNDIGTDNLPATRGKSVKSGQYHPVKSRLQASFAVVPTPCDAISMSSRHSFGRRSVPAMAGLPLSRPLLI